MSGAIPCFEAKQPDENFGVADETSLLARIDTRPIEVTSRAALLWRFRHDLDHARLEQVEWTTWSAGYCPGFDRALGIGDGRRPVHLAERAGDLPPSRRGSDWI